MDIDLANINVRSGVNEQGKGFCTIVATSAAGDILLGQMTPECHRCLHREHER